jgi:hypothetical protein
MKEKERQAAQYAA